MDFVVDNDWGKLLADEVRKPYFQQLQAFVKEEYRQQTVYPEQGDIFNALRCTPYESVKVVLLGQDPYHGPGQAHGLSFSVKAGLRLPPSLKNMLKELHNDLGCSVPDSGSLLHWANQGVLLLNTVLTVREGEPHSHKGQGWEVFTDRIISLLNDRERPVVFLLWGAPAQLKSKLITHPRHRIVTSVHPSPLSANRGFFGSRPYSQANQFLEGIGSVPIDWQLPLHGV